jgi:hypothetical protein
MLAQLAGQVIPAPVRRYLAAKKAEPAANGKAS